MKRKNKHIYLGLLFVIICTTKVLAQQDPMYSMYMFDKALINPGYCGSSNWAVGTIKDREQFMGLNGRPSTKTINFHSPIQAKHIGLGFKVVKDKIAIIENMNVTGMFSYHLNMAGGKLSLGMEAGMFSRKINFNDLIVTSLGDQALVNGGTQKSVVPELSAGFYYQKKNLFLGMSFYHLLKSNFNFKSPQEASHLYKHINIVAGKAFEINRNISYEPSVLIKYQPSSKMQLDLNNIVYYQDRFGLGLQYRTQDAVSLLLKCNITEGLRVGYSYDVTVSKFSKYSKGAHELMISYGIKLPPPPVQKEVHPRFYF